MTAEDELVAEFQRRMVGIYDRAKKEAGYNATLFLRMLGEHGGLETARRLVLSTAPSQGFTQLWMRHRLDLTVEHLVLEERFQPLFDDELRERARQRLDEYSDRPN